MALASLHKPAKATATPSPAPTPTATPQATPAPAVTTPTPRPATPRPIVTTPTPVPVTPTPSPTPPTTVQIGSRTYSCDESDNIHWKGLVYASKSPTYSYTSPGGGQLNSYAQWTNITGLSCSTTAGWLQRGSEYFWGQDLVVT
ncbi:MAG TPA: hypothetical protein VLI05_04190 [Candidatus Saccharimonadia bacterium]|nr:hypothetical protein [Candidatus Saccharimonadia bacterium]